MSGFGVGEIASTMRAMGHANTHQNGGGHLAVCVTGDITHTLKAEGFDASEDGTGRGQPIVATVGALCAHTYTGGMGGRVDAAAQGYALATATREVAGCITSNYGKQLDNSDTALGPNVAIQGMAVRRLTPRECERLQGFEDDYTRIPLRNKNGKLTGKFTADGPRYKALGNSWAVPNVRWIGRRIAAQLESK